jgi:hypothetical protein
VFEFFLLQMAAAAGPRRSARLKVQEPKKQETRGRARHKRSPSPSSTKIRQLEQQLADTKAELRRMSEELQQTRIDASAELQTAIRNERIDALCCLSCGENLRCSECDECIDCCQAGERCKFSNKDADNRNDFRGFHIYYRKPPLNLNPDSESESAVESESSSESESDLE